MRAKAKKVESEFKEALSQKLKKLTPG